MHEASWKPKNKWEAFLEAMVKRKLKIAKVQAFGLDYPKSTNGNNWMQSENRPKDFSVVNNKEVGR